jgi:hypothetical protein
MEEDLLHKLVGLVRVAHALPSERGDAALEPNAEVAERLAVALLGAQD